MSPKQRRRLAFAASLIIAGAVGAVLVVTALRDNVLYFYSPSDVASRHVAAGVDFRIGGLVEKGSVVREPHAVVRFIVTDGKSRIPVEYAGILPDLFREGQGVVALGALLPSGVFSATQILAKHDERYMPPEVVDALKRSGHWKEGG
jgi:cytochrome c-type biogenesis protein CcmE